MPHRPMFAATLVCLLLSAPAGAATFAATKTEDSADGVCDADCSLREAVIAANANPGADEVLLPAGTYLLSLAGAGDDGGDLDVSDALELRGAGTEETILDAAGLGDRVLDVNAAAVRASNLTLANGSSSEGGGCARNAGGDLALVNALVRNCTSLGFKGGGGVLNDAASLLTLVGSRVEDSLASQGYGGGVYNRGVLALTGTSVSRNAAPSAGFGGGGLFNTGEATLYGCVFASNSAHAGGAIFEYNSFSNHAVSLTVERCSFVSNLAPGAGGGAIRATRDAVYVAGSVFESNSAKTDGGAILAESTGPIETSMTIENSTFAGNSAGGMGGALRLAAENGSATIVNSTFKDNSGGSASTAGQAISQDVPAIALANNVIDRRPGPGGACGTVSGAPPVSLGGNVARDASCNLTLPSDAPGVDPGLAPEGLGWNGGPTKTWAVSASSPALGRGVPEQCLSEDQRGFPRASACTAGAVEDAAPRCPPDAAYAEDWLNEILGGMVPPEMDPGTPGAIASCLRTTVAGLP